MGSKMTAIVTLCGADQGFKVAKCIVFEISLVLWVTRSNLGDFAYKLDWPLRFQFFGYQKSTYLASTWADIWCFYVCHSLIYKK